MKELQTIISEAKRLREENIAAILATVVDVRGSSYRLPGARMLISETGEMFGTVSGGCLEADVLERARRVLKSGAAEILTYDTSGEADSVFSLNMGCNGIIRILLEPADGSDFFGFVEKCFQTRKRGVVATLIASKDESKIGSRYFFDEFETASAAFASEFERQIFADASKVFANGDSQYLTCETENGAAEVFLEIINPPLNLIIFGAGFDAIPLHNFAKALGWRVCVVDHRAAFAIGDRFPGADEIIVSRPENLPEKLNFNGNSAAVIMTHNYAHDHEILKFLLSKKLAYIGALGPKKRTENLLRELRKENAVFDEMQLKKLYAPVGLDIGAANPETIALSIVAEINSVLSNRAGGFLRLRRGSIYNRQG